MSPVVEEVQLSYEKLKTSVFHFRKNKDIAKKE